nr:GNAT family N-acyltransferase [Cochlodiniinecator piscidefendens]
MAGRYVSRYAQNDEDLLKAQRLRARVFYDSNYATDADDFDVIFKHVLIEDSYSAELVGCFRIQIVKTETELNRGYCAQFYGLPRSSDFNAPMLELGRFCIDPSVSDPDVLRMAWATLTSIVDEHDIKFMFGCTSFTGTDPVVYQNAFGLLTRKHLAPEMKQPTVRAKEIYEFSKVSNTSYDPKKALLELPQLLRTYLMMGGWVSDHAVIDRDLNTLHVFTGLEVAGISEGRKRLLRVISG